MIKALMTASFLCFALGSGAAFAQTPPPVHPAAKATSADKQAISKACSTQADTKGLHGKERKTFRSTCKKNGGKAD